MRAAVEIVLRKLGENNRIWGFKDPRTCRLLKFWRQVFIAAKCEVRIVIAVRNPASVAASLAERNGIPLVKAYYLWLQHVLPSLGFMKEARRVVLDYDELLSNPYLQIVRVSTGLGLPLPAREDSRVEEFANEFLEKNGLRHTCFTEDDLASDGRAPAIVAGTYNLLRRLATDQASLNSPDVQSELDALSARLADAFPAFDYINEIEDGMAARDGQLAHLNQVVAARDREIDAYREQAEGIVAQLHNTNALISHLNEDSAERDRRITRLNEEVTDYVQREIDAGESRLPDGFDPDVYLQLNPDVAAAGFNPKMHYLRHGRHEKRLYTLPVSDLYSHDGAQERQAK